MVLTCTRTAQYTAGTLLGEQARLCAKHYYEFIRTGKWKGSDNRPLDSFMGKANANESETAVLDTDTGAPSKS